MPPCFNVGQACGLPTWEQSLRARSRDMVGAAGRAPVRVPDEPDTRTDLVDLYVCRRRADMTTAAWPNGKASDYDLRSFRTSEKARVYIRRSWVRAPSWSIFARVSPGFFCESWGVRP